MEKKMNPNKEFIDELGTKLQSISKIAIAQYTPVVNEMITQKVIDDNQIQKTLDGLLSFTVSGAWERETLKGLSIWTNS